MRKAGPDEAQSGIKIARRNINNLRYADDTILTVESIENSKSFLMKVKEESENAALKPNILFSAIKKNTFESVLMRWMKLKPIIQSEVARKKTINTVY